MFRARTVMLAVLLTTAAARASPYWIEYEPAGGHFPEEEGWYRFTGYGGDQRAIEDGWLVMDGLADPRIYDYALTGTDGGLDPGAGELFIAQWKLRVDEAGYYYDPGVGIFSDEKWAVGFVLNETTIYSAFETDVSASFEPGVPHTFAFQSSDMRAYVLSIDGTPAINGSFWLSLTGPAIAWGDMVQGGFSLARWDYFRFGVVPEGNSLVMGGSIVTLLPLCRARTRR